MIFSRDSNFRIVFQWKENLEFVTIHYCKRQFIFTTNRRISYFARVNRRSFCWSLIELKITVLDIRFSHWSKYSRVFLTFFAIARVLLTLWIERSRSWKWYRWLIDELMWNLASQTRLTSVPISADKYNEHRVYQLRQCYELSLILKSDSSRCRNRIDTVLILHFRIDRSIHRFLSDFLCSDKNFCWLLNCAISVRCSSRPYWYSN